MTCIPQCYFNVVFFYLALYSLYSAPLQCFTLRTSLGNDIIAIKCSPEHPDTEERLSKMVSLYLISNNVCGHSEDGNSLTATMVFPEGRILQKFRLPCLSKNSKRHRLWTKKLTSHLLKDLRTGANQAALSKPAGRRRRASLRRPDYIRLITRGVRVARPTSASVAAHSNTEKGEKKKGTALRPRRTPFSHPLLVRLTLLKTQKSARIPVPEGQAYAYNFNWCISLHSPFFLPWQAFRVEFSRVFSQQMFRSANFAHHEFMLKIQPSRKIHKSYLWSSRKLFIQWTYLQVIIFAQPNASDLGEYLQPFHLNIPLLAELFETDVYAFDYSG